MEGSTQGKCKECPYESRWSFALNHHAKQHLKDWGPTELFDCSSHDVEMYNCDNCPFEAALRISLYNHNETGCRSSLFVQAGRGLQGCASVFNERQCEKCEFRTFSEIVLLRHARENCVKQEREEGGSVQDKSSTKWLECAYCSYKAKRRRGLDEHVLSKHTSSDQIEWFQCANCPYKTKVKRHLSLHLTRIHLDQKKFACTHCLYKTNIKHNLKKHFTHRHIALNEIVWFNCAQCPYKGKTNQGLKRHIKEKHAIVNQN